MYWWNPKIGAIRKTANHLRRVHERIRKRAGPDAAVSAEEEAKKARLKLVKAIKIAKDIMWKKLCDEVEHDPWGRPFKLVMYKLGKSPPIPGLNIPGRIEAIVGDLFPQHPLCQRIL